MKQDFPNVLISFVFGVMTLILGSVLLMAIEPRSPTGLVADPSLSWPDFSDQAVSIGGATTYGAVLFSGGHHDDWLRVERSNKKDKKAVGFDPCYTTVRSQFLPVVKKVGKIYEVAFVSDIGKDDLP